MQTLVEVLSNRAVLLARLLRKAGSDMPLFESTDMDAVMVLDDMIAQRYLEANYVYDTHIAPHRLPGTAPSIGDIIDHEGKTYMTIHFPVMAANFAALHQFREFEPLVIEWNQRKDAIGGEVSGLIEQIRAIDPGAFGIEPIKNFERIASSVGRWPTDTPSTKLVDALEELSRKLAARKKKGMNALARSSRLLAKELRPYSAFTQNLWLIRKENDHKGIPYVENGMVAIGTPAASGGATMHTYTPSDDVNDIMPSANDLFMISAQAGNIPVAYVGGGSRQGEQYFMLPPRTPFFPLAQEMMNANQELGELWEKVKVGATPEERSERGEEWFVATVPLKGEAVLQTVPKLVGERVLGFHIDMNFRRGTALMRPIVAKSLYDRERDAVEEAKISTIWPKFDYFLYESGTGYGEYQSVFGRQTR